MKLKILGLMFLLTSTSLFAGKKIDFKEADANRWVYVLKNKDVPANELFKFKGNSLIVTDVTAGYIRTQKKYKNFTLDVDWKFLKDKSNSGVLVHILPNDTVWPTCYQAQLKAYSAGDIICMNGLKATECTNNENGTVVKMNVSNEQPTGAWNHIKVISKDGTLTVYINGELQNKITGMSVKKGYIGFQAEGKPMEFKDLVIK